MAVYRIYPEKDATISSEPNVAGFYANTGKDEILEIGTYTDILDIARSSRALIKFNETEIASVISSVGTGSFQANLHLYLASGDNVEIPYIIYSYPIYGAWTEGRGKRDDSPIDLSGVSWQYRTALSSSWIAAGGDYFNIPLPPSQSMDPSDNQDLHIDVTSVITDFYTGMLENNGFLLKLQNNLEFTSGSAPYLKYYSSDTNTIFSPYLEIKWDDQIYSSSLPEISSTNLNYSIKNNRPVFLDEDIFRFRLSIKPKYPLRTFTTSSIYLQNYILPSASYWGIVDDFSREMIIDFDENYTKISADDTGNYFDVYMDALHPERYYRILIKTTLDGSTIVLDDKNANFKVTKYV